MLLEIMVALVWGVAVGLASWGLSWIFLKNGPLLRLWMFIVICCAGTLIMAVTT